MFTQEYWKQLLKDWKLAVCFALMAGLAYKDVRHDAYVARSEKEKQDLIEKYESKIEGLNGLNTTILTRANENKDDVIEALLRLQNAPVK